MRVDVAHADIPAERHVAELVVPRALDEPAFVAFLDRCIVSKGRSGAQRKRTAEGSGIAEVKLRIGGGIVGSEERVAREGNHVPELTDGRTRNCRWDGHFFVGAWVQRVLPAQLGRAEPVFLPLAAAVDLEFLARAPVERGLEVVVHIVSGRGAQADLRKHPRSGIGQIGRAEIEDRIAAVRRAVIVAVIVDVELVERQRVLHRVAVL
ncbi:MAG: hypothetical protein ACJ8FT_07355 [Sphingomonas sp.]